MNNETAKQEVVNKALDSLMQIERELKRMKEAVLGNNDSAIKRESTRLVFLNHFIESRLDEIAMQSFLAYLDAKKGAH